MKSKAVSSDPTFPELPESQEGAQKRLRGKILPVPGVLGLNQKDPGGERGGVARSPSQGMHRTMLRASGRRKRNI